MLPSDKTYSLAIEVLDDDGVWRYMTIADDAELAIFKRLASLAGIQHRVCSRHGLKERAVSEAGGEWPAGGFVTEWVVIIRSNDPTLWPGAVAERFARAVRRTVAKAVEAERKVAVPAMPAPPPVTVPLIASGEQVGTVEVVEVVEVPLLPLDTPEAALDRLRQRVKDLEHDLAFERAQRTDIAMGASIKLAAAAMVLSNLLRSTRLDSHEKAALQGVLDAIPQGPKGAIAQADQQARLAQQAPRRIGRAG